jgi:hypothetical protein
MNEIIFATKEILAQPAQEGNNEIPCFVYRNIWTPSGAGAHIIHQEHQ